MSPKDVKVAISHLKKDKVLAKIISQFENPDFEPGKDHFGALVSSIIYQQISGKAASNIERRFRSLFKGGKLKAGKVLDLSDKDFKSVGISPQKMKYIRDLATKFLDGSVDPSKFHKMSDEEIRIHLVSVKGIGTWTADMFLMFTLNRMDVLPTGDLAIAKAFATIFKMRKLPDAKKMEKLALSWRPYRTVASWYLWKISDREKEK